MQASEIKDIAFDLKRRLQGRKELLAPFLGEANEVDELEGTKEAGARHVRGTNVVDELADLIWKVGWTYCSNVKDEGAINKSVEKRIKVAMYRLESLLCDIEAKLVENGGDDVQPTFTETRAKAKHILEELIPLSSDESLTGSAVLTGWPVIGEKYEKKKQELINWLQDSESKNRVFLLHGRAGVGKTTLARHISDPECNIKLWVSATDISTGEQLVSKVLQEIDWKIELPSDMDLVEELKKRVAGVRYLLFLDDFSDVKLVKYLLSDDKKNPFFDGADKGSKIIITSKVEVEDSRFETMVGLSEDESFKLLTAFSSLELSDIGKEICRQCENIPAVLHIIASILSSKTTLQEWKQFHDVVMPSVSSDATSTVLFAAKLINQPFNESSDRKNQRCFLASCSLLPKNYSFNKDDLILLWITLHQRDFAKTEFQSIFDKFFSEHFFLKADSSDIPNGSSLEADETYIPDGSLEADETYIPDGSSLEADETDISDGSYKISELGYELMKYVGGDDYCMVDNHGSEIDHEIIRHASFIVGASWQAPSWLSKAKQLQSLLFWPNNPGDSITLSKQDLSLVKQDLRMLEASYCKGFRLFKKMRKILFSKSTISSNSVPQYISSKLDNFYDLLLVEQDNEGISLAMKLVYARGVNKLSIDLTRSTDADLVHQTHRIKFSADMSVLPSPYYGNAKMLEFAASHHGWNKGKEIPSWLVNEYCIMFQNLVSIRLEDCGHCQYLPTFDTLHFLKSLQLMNLCSVKVLQIGGASTTTNFYKALELLVLTNLPQLEGWSTTKGAEDVVQKYSFPVLSEITIRVCPMLVSMPSVPKLKKLDAINIKAELLKHLLTAQRGSSLIIELKIDGCKAIYWGDKEKDPKKAKVSLEDVWHYMRRSVRSLKLINSSELESLPRGLEVATTLKQLSLCWLSNFKIIQKWIVRCDQLTQLTICYCPKLKTLPGLPALKQLEVRYCPRLSQFPESFPNLKVLQVCEFRKLQQLLLVSGNLEELEIDNCTRLSDIGAWERLKSLRSLKLSNISEWESLPAGLESLTTVKELRLFQLYNLQKLPEWIKQFTQLSRLAIQDCPKLTTLPTVFGSLSSLEHLEIEGCWELKQLPATFPDLKSLKLLEVRNSQELETRCRNQHGEDWLRIQYIPTVILGESPPQEISETASTS